jgi:geranylgeranyl pyrophosphate synthase
VGSDLLKHKKTLPILHGMQADPRLRAKLRDAAFDEEDVPEALELLEAAGSRTYTENKAKAYHEAALRALDQSGGTGEAQAALHTLAQKLMGRRH